MERQAHNLKVVGSNPTPATIKDVPPPPVEAAVVFLAEGEDLGECTDDGDLAMAAHLTGRHLDSIDERTNGLDDLRACRLVLQRLLKLPYLFAIKFRQIGMDNDFHIVLLGRQIRINVSLTSLQAPQLIAHRARVSVAPSDEVDAAFDAALDILAFF